MNDPLNPALAHRIAPGLHEPIDPYTAVKAEPEAHKLDWHCVCEALCAELYAARKAQADSQVCVEACKAALADAETKCAENCVRVDRLRQACELLCGPDIPF
jgi:hypothetical protein